jgi:hypothetical protein
VQKYNGISNPTTPKLRNAPAPYSLRKHPPIDIINSQEWIRLIPENAFPQYLAPVLSEKASYG